MIFQALLGTLRSHERTNKRANPATKLRQYGFGGFLTLLLATSETTGGNVFVRKCAAPIRALMAPRRGAVPATCTLYNARHHLL